MRSYQMVVELMVVETRLVVPVPAATLGLEVKVLDQ
jgi:hypothetical protein